MWQPIDLDALLQAIGNAEKLMDAAERRLWEFIRTPPEKWHQHPWGDQGGGFWVVGIFGNQVLWYNDIEDGFNVSSYIHFGTIAEYSCNQDELHQVLRSIQILLQTGAIPGRFVPPSAL